MSQLQTQNTALQAWKPPKIDDEKALQIMRATFEKCGIDNVELPPVKFVKWFAEMTGRPRLRNVKSDNGEHLVPIIHDIMRTATEVYGYELKDKHTQTEIVAMANFVFSEFPNLYYNHKKVGDFYERGELNAAFTKANAGALDFDFTVYHNGKINANTIGKVLRGYMLYRRAAQAAVTEFAEAEAKAIKDAEQAERNERINANFWPETWAKVNEKCEWQHIDDVHAFFYEGWIDEHKLHEFSNDEKNAAYEIGKTLIFNRAKVTKSDPQAKPSEIGLSERIIQLMGEPESMDDKARAKAMGQRVMLYLHFTGRNPLDEPLTKPKKK